MSKLLELPKNLDDEVIKKLAESTIEDYGDLTRHDAYQNPDQNWDAIFEFAKRVEHEKNLQFLKQQNMDDCKHQRLEHFQDHDLCLDCGWTNPPREFLEK